VAPDSQGYAEKGYIVKPLLEGIFTYANTASDFRTAIGGRFYFAEAIQGATFPFAVYSLIALDIDYHFAGHQINPLMQISIFSKDTGSVEVNTIWGYMAARFDDAEITVSGYSAVEFRRDQARLLREPENNIWHYATDYELILTV
jgi:hypothetical protein